MLAARVRRRPLRAAAAATTPLRGPSERPRGTGGVCPRGARGVRPRRARTTAFTKTSTTFGTSSERE
eukprot:2385475-Pyramimonas_sp.AAC.1